MFVSYFSKELKALPIYEYRYISISPKAKQPKLSFNAEKDEIPQ
jgi:hypothetical protein